MIYSRDQYGHCHSVMVTYHLLLILGEIRHNVKMKKGGVPNIAGIQYKSKIIKHA